MKIDGEALDPGEQIVDPELDRVCDFLKTLTSVRSIRELKTTLDFKEQAPVDLAMQRFLCNEHNQRDTSSRLYLAPPFAGRYGTSEQVDVDFLPRVSRAGKNSRHGVFFGDLGFDLSTSLLPVAVKIHAEDRHVQSCLREYFNNVGCSQQAIDCPQAVGVVLSRNQAYFLTELDETLTTLDSINWSGFHGAMEENPGMREIWSHVAKITAALHSVGNSVHGDLAPRNIGINTDGGVRLIDLEDSRIDASPPRDAEVRFGSSYQDLSMLVEALCRPLNLAFKPGIGLFTEVARDWWKDFCYLIFDENVEDRLSLARVGSHHTRHEAAVRSELDVLRQSLNEDVEMHKFFAINTLRS